MKTETISMQELEQLRRFKKVVQLVRGLQIRYFRERDSGVLQSCKRGEYVIDQALEGMLISEDNKIIKEAEQGDFLKGMD